VKIQRLIAIGLLLTACACTGIAQAQEAQTDTVTSSQQLKQEKKAEKAQKKADKAEKKAAKTKQAKKADKAQRKADKQAEKAATTP
jgi:hypothetical protein